MTTGTRTALLLAALFLGPTLSASSGSAFGLVGNISAGLGKKWRSEPSFPNPVHEGGTWEPKVDAMLGHRSLRSASAWESGESDPFFPMPEEASRRFLVGPSSSILWSRKKAPLPEPVTGLEQVPFFRLSPGSTLAPSVATQTSMRIQGANTTNLAD